MNHVASAGNAIELTVRDFSVEPPGLLIDVDDAVPLTRYYVNWHF
jgi:hypothetical protein